MKLSVLILLTIMLSSPTQGQVGRYLKKNWPSLSCMTLAGACDGFNEVIKFDYQSFEKTFPDARNQFWNPSVSWRNKWKNGNPDEGRKFPGSTTIFVWTTDGYHLTRTLTKAFVCGAVTVKICGDKQKWWMYGIDFISHSVAYSIGFNVVLHGVFRHEF